VTDGASLRSRLYSSAVAQGRTGAAQRHPRPQCQGTTGCKRCDLGKGPARRYLTDCGQQFAAERTGAAPRHRSSHASMHTERTANYFYSAIVFTLLYGFASGKARAHSHSAQAIEDYRSCEVRLHLAQPRVYVKLLQDAAHDAADLNQARLHASATKSTRPSSSTGSVPRGLQLLPPRQRRLPQPHGHV
jgi:hypothetical protein